MDKEEFTEDRKYKSNGLAYQVLEALGQPEEELLPIYVDGPYFFIHVYRKKYIVAHVTVNENAQCIMVSFHHQTSPYIAKKIIRTLSDFDILIGLPHEVDDNGKTILFDEETGSWLMPQHYPAIPMKV